MPAACPASVRGPPLHEHPMKDRAGNRVEQEVQVRIGLATTNDNLRTRFRDRSHCSRRAQGHSRCDDDRRRPQGLTALPSWVECSAMGR